MSKGLKSIGDYKDLYFRLKVDRRTKRERGIKIPKDENKTYLKGKKTKSFPFTDKKEIEGKIKHVTPIVTNEEILHRRLLEIRERYDEEIRSHGEQTSIKEGFVYIIVNPSFPGWLKLGMAFDYEKRLATYNQCDPEMKYSIIALRWTDDRRILETALLKNLADICSNRRGEWFKFDSDLFINAFYTITV
jgi:hypothetical protein